jgi:hypothetical protein
VNGTALDSAHEARLHQPTLPVDVDRPRVNTARCEGSLERRIADNRHSATNNQ